MASPYPISCVNECCTLQSHIKIRAYIINVVSYKIINISISDKIYVSLIPNVFLSVDWLSLHYTLLISFAIATRDPLAQ